MLVVVALVAVVALVCAVVVFGGAWVVDRVRGTSGQGAPSAPRTPKPPRAPRERRGRPGRGAASPSAPPSSGPDSPPTASGRPSSGSAPTAGAGPAAPPPPPSASDRGAAATPAPDPAPATPPAPGAGGRGSDEARSTPPGTPPAGHPEPVTLQQLDPEMRSVYATSWQRTQERFRREPESALTDADKLVTLLLDERGYPTRAGGLVTEVSADPAGVVPDYMTAHRITAGQRPLTAQEMRKAMDAYRRLVSTLLEDRPARGRR